MHSALRELGGFEIDVRWELMQRDAFGNDTFEELMAIKGIIKYAQFSCIFAQFSSIIFFLEVVHRLISIVCEMLSYDITGVLYV